MQVKYSALAKKSLTNVALFVEQTNTKGSGQRWKDRFLKKIKKYTQPIKYALCRHKVYAANDFSCIAIDNWIIIFKTDSKYLYVHQIVLASSLY